MRHLNFAKPDHYKYVYIASIANRAYELGPTERRTHARLMDTLESIGKRDDNGWYNLNTDGVIGINLEEAEFSLLKKLVNIFPWPPADSRMVVEIEDWLESIKEGLPKPKPVSDG